MNPRFSAKRKRSQLLLHGAEERGAGAEHPLAWIGAVAAPAGYAPRSGTPWQVIEANRIDLGKEGAHSVDAPAGTLFPLACPSRRPPFPWNWPRGAAK